MTREEKICILDRYRKLIVAPECAGALEMAIYAIHAQKTPLDRGRWTGCPCCEGKEDKNKDENFIPRQLYCDVCGRPLTELA